MMQLAVITGNRKMQFRMILSIILNWRGGGSCKLQASSLKKRFDIQDYPGIKNLERYNYEKIYTHKPAHHKT
jgi:hypothetical protein